MAIVLPSRDIDRPTQLLIDGFQRDFPIVARPYAKIGARIGLSEAQVIERLAALSARGAVSRVGARGLMQVMPGSHKGKIRKIGGTRELFDPAKNIHTGSQILVEYLEDHSGDLRRALLNYNGSLGTRSSFPDKVIRIYRGLQRVTVEG
ncbi:MAG: transglycosylase SLT domain-containing protein [Candidatus Competibacter phosphatis]